MVGLSSYLLIGFWHERPSAIAAAKKAFVMNAIGDATMALALFLLIQKAGSVEFFVLGGDYSSTVATLVALGLLGGAVAKSAQLPLQTWLPDAMEGPTPVSALIHAATMVTAGVYLIVRTHSIFESAPHVADLAAGLGAATLLVAGLIALVQVDIKRVIAYSTMSQIGYMFLGVGLGAYANGMFHLMTHAFFKALLFMAAGIVIHALADEQDIRKMGGLRQLMPRTYLAFLIGSLALVGIFPFAGFFSKDPILAAALDSGAYGYVLWAAGLAGTFLTGLYTFRLLFLVFWGEPSPFVREHFHAPKRDVVGLSLGVPVAILAVLSDHRRLDPVGAVLASRSRPGSRQSRSRPSPPRTGRSGCRSALALLLGIGGMYVAWLFYGGAGETIRAAFRVRAARARAQVLLRRALRRGLLPSDRLAREGLVSLGRGSPRRRVLELARTGHARSRPRRRTSPDRSSPHLCPRDRLERRRPRRRLRGR